MSIGDRQVPMHTLRARKHRGDANGFFTEPPGASDGLERSLHTRADIDQRQREIRVEFERERMLAERKRRFELDTELADYEAALERAE